MALISLLIPQKKAIRIISGKPWREHTASLFSQLRILNVFQLHKVRVACFMIKVRHNELITCLIYRYV